MSSHTYVLLLRCFRLVFDEHTRAHVVFQVPASAYRRKTACVIEIHVRKMRSARLLVSHSVARLWWKHIQCARARVPCVCVAFAIPLCLCCAANKMEKLFGDNRHFPFSTLNGNASTQERWNARLANGQRQLSVAASNKIRRHRFSSS